MKVFFCLFLILISSCRPRLGENDPVNLRFEKRTLWGLERIEELSEEVGVRVFFWNIAWGSLNKGSVLDFNLLELVNSNSRPDILILSEFKTSAISANTNTELKKHYPYRAFIKYSISSEVGIAVYSWKPFTARKTEMLEWAPSHYNQEGKKAYKENWKSKSPHAKHWDRPYIHLTWEIDGENYYLVPVHLLAPWIAIYETEGKWSMINSFMGETQNPLLHQTLSLRKKLERDFGKNLDRGKLLVVGDFNIDKRIFGIEPAIYNYLSEDLSELFYTSPPTFPTKASPESKKPPFDTVAVKLDHGFTNENLKSEDAEVLPLKGSDHYPLYMVVQPKSSWWF